MAQDWAKKFYRSKRWRECRRAYIIKVHGLCDICKSKGEYTPGWIVHHKVYLTESNINDPSISLNHNNLIYVCEKCHNREHFASKVVREDLMFDTDGNLIKRYKENK